MDQNDYFPLFLLWVGGATFSIMAMMEGWLSWKLFLGIWVLLSEVCYLITAIRGKLDSTSTEDIIVTKILFFLVIFGFLGFLYSVGKLLYSYVWPSIGEWGPPFLIFMGWATLLAGSLVAFFALNIWIVRRIAPEKKPRKPRKRKKGRKKKSG